MCRYIYIYITMCRYVYIYMTTSFVAQLTLPPSKFTLSRLECQLLSFCALPDQSLGQVALPLWLQWLSCATHHPTQSGVGWVGN